MTPDTERLRRFALAVGLILIAYVAAGVELEAGATISVLGLPFVVRTPELLPLGLMLASAYGLVRFFYYGFMLGLSPQQHRKDLLRKLYASGGHGTYEGSVIFGPAKYSTTPSTQDRIAVEAELCEIINAFPKVWRTRVHGTVEPFQTTDENGEIYVLYSAEVKIPVGCRVGALLQDLDYSAPIWLNIVALTVALAKT